MSLELKDSNATNKNNFNRRMSLKGPALRVTVKTTNTSQTNHPPALVSKPNSTVPSLIDRRQSLSAKQFNKSTVIQQPAAVAPIPASVNTNANMDSINLVTMRLDNMERQITELQSMVSRVVALEELMKPFKPLLHQNQLDITEMKLALKSLMEKEHMNQSPVNITNNYPKNVYQTPEQVVAAALEDPVADLDRSFDEGELSEEEYSKSLKIALDQSIQSSGRNFSSNETPTRLGRTGKVQQNARGSPASKPSSVTRTFHRNPSKSISSSSHLNVYSQTKPQSPKPKSPKPKHQPLQEISANRVGSPKPSAQAKTKKCVETPSDNMFAMMESIQKEEKVNVTLWLGLDISELNRAISTLNEYATTQRFEMTTLTELYVTEDDVKQYCQVDAKKAKAIVLLLCKLKRLQSTKRGNQTSYRLLSGNTLAAAVGK